MITSLATQLLLDLTVGKKVSYEVTQAYVSKKEKESTVFIFAVTQTVEKQSLIEGASKIRTRHVLKKTIVDGLEIPQSSDDNPLERTELRLATGHILQRELMPYDPVLRERQTRPIDLLLPSGGIVPGLTWERIEDRSNATGTPAATWRWQCVSQDAKEITISVNFSEHNTLEPITADGTLRIDQKSGWPNRIDVVVHNTVLPGDSEGIPVDLTITWRKI